MKTYLSYPTKTSIQESLRISILLQEKVFMNTYPQNIKGDS